MLLRPPYHHDPRPTAGKPRLLRDSDTVPYHLSLTSSQRESASRHLVEAYRPARSKNVSFAAEVLNLGPAGLMKTWNTLQVFLIRERIWKTPTSGRSLVIQNEQLCCIGMFALRFRGLFPSPL